MVDWLGESDYFWNLKAFPNTISKQWKGLNPRGSTLEIGNAKKQHYNVQESILWVGLPFTF